VKGVIVETTAEVRYSMPQFGMGLRFLDLKTDDLAALENLIEGKPLVVPAANPERVEASERLPNHSSAAMLLGNFAVVSLFDVLQIIENNRLGGSLSITSSVGNGEIQFNDGLIVGALTDLTSGIDALRCFLDITEGSFEFKQSAIQYPNMINPPSNTSLMLDLLRIKDEEAAALS
jgi:hypothetical protein